MATLPLKAIPPTTSPTLDTVASKIGKLKLQAQESVIKYTSAILQKQRKFSDLQNKMDAIDIAYARYKASEASQTVDGIDVSAASTACNVFEEDDVTPPIVVSQVDSYVAYLAEVFLSGSPLFPVISNPAKRIWAEQLESLLDDHAEIGGYVRQLLLFIRDGVKYNFAAIEVDWDSIEQFTVLEDMFANGGQRVDRKPKKFTNITHLNPRNVVWDSSVHPGDVSRHGDYAGYVTRITETKLKRLLNKWSKEGKVYNADKALLSSTSVTTGSSANFRADPQISHYVGAASTEEGVNWDSWFEPGNNGRRGPPKGLTYEKFVVYARIMPADFGITAPQPNTPQIWKFVTINNSIMVYAERIISAYDNLPILFGQPLEDGLGYQTQSVAEGEIPFQKAATTLFNIRFAAARRAVSDRALYIADMIKPSDINNPTAAPKIPVQISVLSNKGIEDAYKQIPFDLRGTETTIQDAATIVSFSKDLHGINNPRQGAFQKGNKSVKEWDDTMSGSDGRMRIPALVLEYQVFSPLKAMLKLNIFQYGEDAQVTSQVTGVDHDVKIDELRKQVLSFRVADGYTPKSKIANTDTILAGFQMISSSPILQQAYGMYLPGMFAHFMTLGGVRGFEEYDPMNPANQKAPATPIAPNELQAGTVANAPPTLSGVAPAAPQTISTAANIPPMA